MNEQMRVSVYAAWQMAVIAESSASELYYALAKKNAPETNIALQNWQHLAATSTHLHSLVLDILESPEHESR